MIFKIGKQPSAVGSADGSLREMSQFLTLTLTPALSPWRGRMAGPLPMRWVNGTTCFKFPNETGSKMTGKEHEDGKGRNDSALFFGPQFV